MQKETMNTVTIDKVTQVYDGQNNLTGETREEVVNGRFGGTSNVVSVIKAYESKRTALKYNLADLEIGVNGNPF